LRDRNKTGYGGAVTFFVKLPRRPGCTSDVAAPEHYLNIISGEETLGQRELRRKGYAGYEPETAATMCALFELATRANDRFTFFDVGANFGHYSLLCKALYRGRVDVVSFEPTPTTAKWLRAANDANALEIRTEELAVGEVEQTVTLYLSDKSDASNSLNPEFRQKHKGTVEVRCTTLDAYCRSHGRAPHLLKIDVETLEAQVLRGARRMLSEQRPYIVLEVLNKNGVNLGSAIADVMREVGGYSFYHIAAGPTFVQSDEIEADPGSEMRDWLLAPKALPTDFVEIATRWRQSLADCSASENITRR